MRPSRVRKIRFKGLLRSLAGSSNQTPFSDPIERGTMPGQRIAPLANVADDDCPYFAILLVHGHGRRPKARRDCWPAGGDAP